jgi:hypothetical protein
MTAVLIDRRVASMSLTCLHSTYTAHADECDAPVAKERSVWDGGDRPKSRSSVLDGAQRRDDTEPDSSKLGGGSASGKAEVRLGSGRDSRGNCGMKRT